MARKTAGNAQALSREALFFLDFSLLTFFVAMTKKVRTAQGI
jgi:hypothetical protein